MLAACAAAPLMLPKFPARQLAVINIPLTLICLYMVWAMAYIAQLHLFQMPELITGDQIHHPS